MMTWSPLEHRVFRLFRNRNWSHSRWVILVSGGADSICALKVLRNLQPALKYQLEVLHFHHGDFDNHPFREASEALVRNLCAKWQIELRVFKNFDPQLKSEAELRMFRRRVIEQLESEHTYFVSGHHQDDLLETRLLRLIRGTGGRGLVAMKVQNSNRLRPLLTSTRAEIEQELTVAKLNYLRDPSRSDFRSWIRHEWLPLLEKRQSSARISLGRSLEVLAGSLEKQRENPLFAGDDLPRMAFAQQSAEQQSLILMKYFERRGSKRISQALIQECLKQLDKVQIEHTFILAGLRWSIDAKNIRAEALLK